MEEKLKYEKPELIRLSRSKDKLGMGQPCSNGSGATTGCTTGNSDLTNCGVGNSAGNCITGNAPAGCVAGTGV